MSKTDDPNASGKYSVHFNNLALIGFDVSFIWHTQIVPRVMLRYGAGIGLGFVLGSIQKVNCVAGSVNPTTNTCTEDFTQTTNVDKPPVVPIVNLLAGVRFNVIEKLDRRGDRVPRHVSRRRDWLLLLACFPHFPHPQRQLLPVEMLGERDGVLA